MLSARAYTCMHLLETSEIAWSAALCCSAHFGAWHCMHVYSCALSCYSNDVRRASAGNPLHRAGPEPGRDGALQGEPADGRPAAEDAAQARGCHLPFSSVPTFYVSARQFSLQQTPKGWPRLMLMRKKYMKMWRQPLLVRDNTWRWEFADRFYSQERNEFGAVAFRRVLMRARK